MSYLDLEVIHVAAMDRNQCIGINNALPFYVPVDLQHFKQLTQGNTVLMGRKTFESIGKALPSRSNYVLTQDTSWEVPNVTTVHSLNAAFKTIAEQGFDTVYIIGGSQLYMQTLHLADRLELTHIELDVAGDSYYPSIPSYFNKIKSETVQDSKTNTVCHFTTYLKI